MADRLNYIRRLTIVLIVSGAFNVVLVAVILYWTLHDRPPIPYYELKPANLQEQQSPLAIDHSNNEVVRYFKKMPLEWLVGRLKNTQLVENGYTQRDLALAALVDFHHFDFERALAGLPPPNQKRTIVYGKFRDGKLAELTVYPGLSDKHFDSIVAFATRERWPLTSKGLFLVLRKESGRDPSLVDAFYMTPEYLVVEMLFGRGNVAVDKKELLDVLVQGDWKTLISFVDHQRASQDFSAARRQRFLLDYIALHSKAAAKIMLSTEGQFAAKKLDDAHVMLLLQLLETKSPEAEQFALALMASPRSDEVWKLAATRLYEYAGENMPLNQSYHAALSRFIPQNSVIEAAEPVPIVTASTAPPILPPPPRPVVLKPQVASTPKSLVNSTSFPIVKEKNMETNKKQVAVVAPVKQPKPPQNHAKAKSKPQPQVAATNQRKPSPIATKEGQYVVKERDTLWKIAKQYNIDARELKAYNRLESDSLRPGSTLKIPQRR